MPSLKERFGVEQEMELAFVLYWGAAFFLELQNFHKGDLATLRTDPPRLRFCLRSQEVTTIWNFIKRLSFFLPRVWGEFILLAKTGQK